MLAFWASFPSDFASIDCRWLQNKGKLTMNNLLTTLTTRILCLCSEEDGQDLVEYMLLVSLIATAAITSVGPIATILTTMYNNISSSIAAA